MLKPSLIQGRLEAGCDEAGRGPLAGPVVAAAVILPPDYRNPLLNDSKQLTSRQRDTLRLEIETNALAWAVASVEPEEIDRLNILHASTHAMCLAVQQLTTKPQFLLIDGNRFYNETDIPYQCIVKGDAQYLSIAAASILAKTHRDQIMVQLHQQYPHYGWDRNKGYPTPEHYLAIEQHGPSPYHRRSFTLYRQHTLFDN
ncbi:MAG: ribonuclease HII [Bacteroidales bacterium]|nr:ribonuclease HII [Bacteroidales bacterium]